MVEHPTPDPPLTDRFGASRSWLWLAAALLLMVVVQLPTLQLGFVGDDYEWWLETRHRMADPGKWLEPFGGLRLTNPPMLAVDHLVWGTWTPGWHLTSLAIHGAVMALLFGIARRSGFASSSAALIVALWGTSPYTVFMAREVHVRHDPLLLGCWLGVGLLWPGPEKRWTGRRIGPVLALVVIAALTKESWVVLPGFAAAYELAFRRRGFSAVIRTAFLWSLGSVAFVAAYLLRPAVDSSYAVGYYSGGLRTAAKIPSTLAAFCGLADLDTSSLRFGPAEWLASAVLIAVLVLAVRSRSPALVVGSALFLLPLVPLIPVPVMGVHYGYASFAGFVLAAGGLATLAWERARPPGLRRLVGVAAGAAAVCLFLFGIMDMAGEAADARRRADANDRLVEEAAALLPQIPRDRPLVCVRLEGNVVSARLIEQVEGLPKTYFNRGSYPYGLIGWAELFSWVATPSGGPLWIEIPADDVEQGPFAVIGHADGRFVTLPSDATTAAAAAADWAEQGFPVRVIQPLPTRR